MVELSDYYTIAGRFPDEAIAKSVNKKIEELENHLNLDPMVIE